MCMLKSVRVHVCMYDVLVEIGGRGKERRA